MRKGFKVIISTGLLLMCMGTINSYCIDLKDGFRPARRIESDYFQICIEDDVNIEDVIMRLSVPPSIKSVIKEPVSKYHAYDIGNQVDLLYLAVSEIMDMRIKNFRCILKICGNSASFLDVVDNLYGRPVKTAGIYVAENNTIYIDSTSININILGHEMSHALQGNYFLIPPPAKLQEVLSGYVEYQFRKYTNTLPTEKKP